MGLISEHLVAHGEREQELKEKEQKLEDDTKKLKDLMRDVTR